MRAPFTEAFIRAVPKTDLHLHLDGSIRLSTLIELAEHQGVELPAYTEEGLRSEVFKEQYADLAEYLRGFAYTCAVLQDADSLERVAYELAIDSFTEGVRYIEVRFAPQLHIHEGFDAPDTIAAVAKGLARAQNEFNADEAIERDDEPAYRSGIIVCAMRMFTQAFSEYYRRYVAIHRFRRMNEVIAQASVDLVNAAVHARDDLGLPVVGFDLAGQEDGYPAAAHAEAYSLAHQRFLRKTVHAGEAFGPESIFQALTDLHADRIGHGYYLFNPDKISHGGITDRDAYVAALVQHMADRRITIEVCLSSNMQTNPAIGKLEEHNFRHMLAANLSATLCTDNRTISNTTVCKEIGLAIDAFDIAPKMLKQIVVYGFKRSFFPGSYSGKRTYVRKCFDLYEALEAAHGVMGHEI